MVNECRESEGDGERKVGKKQTRRKSREGAAGRDECDAPEITPFWGPAVEGHHILQRRARAAKTNAPWQGCKSCSCPKQYSARKSRLPIGCAAMTRPAAWIKGMRPGIMRASRGVSVPGGSWLTQEQRSARSSRMSRFSEVRSRRAAALLPWLLGRGKPLLMGISGPLRSLPGDSPTTQLLRMMRPGAAWSRRGNLSMWFYVGPKIYGNLTGHATRRIAITSLRRVGGARTTPTAALFNRVLGHRSSCPANSLCGLPMSLRYATLTN